MDKTESNMTLGDIKANGRSNGKGVYVDGWRYADDLLYLVDKTGKMSTPYQYVAQWEVDEGEWEGYDAGWYFLSGEDCQNSTPLPFGCSFVVKSSSQAEGKNPALVFSGEVKGTQKDIPVDNFFLLGNCTPRTIKLGAIKTNSESNGKGVYKQGWRYADDLLYLVDNTGKMSTPYQYVAQWEVDEGEWGGYDAGWYFLSGEDCQNENVTLYPGDGFIVKSSSYAEGKEPVIIIPSAVSESK